MWPAPPGRSVLAEVLQCVPRSAGPSAPAAHLCGLHGLVLPPQRADQFHERVALALEDLAWGVEEEAGIRRHEPSLACPVTPPSLALARTEALGCGRTISAGAEGDQGSPADTSRTMTCDVHRTIHDHQDTTIRVKNKMY
jgi:hypothetical protein